MRDQLLPDCPQPAEIVTRSNRNDPPGEELSHLLASRTDSPFAEDAFWNTRPQAVPGRQSRAGLATADGPFLVQWH